MVKKFLFLIIALVSCFCLFGFSDVDNVSVSSEIVTDLTDTRWTFDSFNFERQWEHDWIGWGKFNVLVEFDDGRSLTPDAEGYSLKVGYNLDVPDENYVSYHFSDVGWVAYKMLAFTYICDVVGGTDVTNPLLIDFFERFLVPYDYFYGVYIMHYNHVSNFKKDAFGVVKVADNVNLSNLQTVNLNVSYDEENKLLQSVSFGSYSFVHDVYINGSLTDYSSDYTLIVLDEECNYNYNLLSFLWGNSDQVMPVYNSVYRSYECELNGDIPLFGTYAINVDDFVEFVSSSGSRGGTVNILIECEGLYYKGFQITYNSNYMYYSIDLLAPVFGTYSDKDLGHFYTNGNWIAPEFTPFTFGTSSLSGVDQDFHDWFTSTTRELSFEPAADGNTLSGVWRANSSLTYLDFSETVTFFSDGRWYDEMEISRFSLPPFDYVLGFSVSKLISPTVVASWDTDFNFLEFSTEWSKTIDFGKYDQYVSPEFYEWFTSNFTYEGESTLVAPSDQHFTQFIPSVFSTVQEALDSFSFYTTASGFELTIWTILIVFVSVSFIVWILKLIAGG